MELIDYLRMLSRHGRLLAVSVLVGLLLSLLYIAATPRVYESAALLFVGNGSGSVSAENALSASRFTLERMDSYAALVDSPEVTVGVKSAVGLDSPPEDIAGALRAEVLGDTVVLRVSAEDRDPEVAASMANIAAARLADVIQGVEAPAGAGRSPIKVTVTRPATLPRGPASPNTTLSLVLGLVVGAGAGLVLAAVRDQVGGQVDGGRTVPAGLGSARPPRPRLRARRAAPRGAAVPRRVPGARRRSTSPVAALVPTSAHEGVATAGGWSTGSVTELGSVRHEAGDRTAERLGDDDARAGRG